MDCLEKKENKVNNQGLIRKLQEYGIDIGPNFFDELRKTQGVVGTTVP